MLKVYHVLLNMCESLEEESELPPKQKENEKSGNQVPRKKSKGKGAVKKKELVKKGKGKKESKRLEEELIETVTAAMTKTYKQKDPKTTALMRDEKGKELMAKAKRTLDYVIKDFQEEVRAKKAK